MKNKYRVLIISCWVLLILASIAKLLGANIFTAKASNETFIKFCNYIQGGVLYYIIGTIFNIVSTSIYLMAVLEEKKPNWKWFIPLVAYATLKTIFNKQNILFFILDIAFVMLLLPILIDKTKWFKILIGIVLNIAFQLISQFLKLNNYGVFDENLVVVLILSIDYYIMLILFYLYSNYKYKCKKKGDSW